MSLICIFAVLVVVFIRWSRVRVIQRDPRGDAPLLLNVVDGVAYDADRHPTSTSGLQREDIKLLPKFSASDHIQTTARDQMVDLATRGLPGTNKRQANNKQFKEDNLSGDKLLGDDAMPKIETIDANSARPLFKDVIPTSFNTRSTRKSFHRRKCHDRINSDQPQIFFGSGTDRAKIDSLL
jgi:hypothetical protein